MRILVFFYNLIMPLGFLFFLREVDPGPRDGPAALISDAPNGRFTDGFGISDWRSADVPVPAA